MDARARMAGARARRTPAAVSPADWKRVQTLFDEAMQREPRERRSFVAEATGGDPELGRELVSLLDAHERAGERRQLISRCRLRHEL